MNKLCTTRLKMGQVFSMFSTFSGEKWNFERVLAHSRKTSQELENLNRHEYLIDVREVNEIKNSGAIPNAINIPLGSLETALKFPTNFAQYLPTPSNLPFPSAENDQLIFTCQSGVRAGRAAGTAQSLGFEKVAVYSGSFSDWYSRINK